MRHMLSYPCHPVYVFVRHPSAVSIPRMSLIGDENECVINDLVLSKARLGGLRMQSEITFLFRD